MQQLLIMAIAFGVTGLLLAIRNLVVSARPAPKKYVVPIMTFDDRNPGKDDSADSPDEWPSVIDDKPVRSPMSLRDSRLANRSEASSFGPSKPFARPEYCLPIKNANRN